MKSGSARAPPLVGPKSRDMICFQIRHVTRSPNLTSDSGLVLGFYNPNPASVAGTVWLDPRSCSAAGSVDPHSQERQTPLPTSYSVSQPRFAEASVAKALRALATLTTIISRLPLSKIETINHLQHTVFQCLDPFRILTVRVMV